MSWSGRTGFALGLEKKVSYNSRGFFPLFFVIYLIWWWREHGGEVVGVGTAFADWIHNATPSSSSPIPLSSWIYHLASSGGMQMLCVCTFSFRRNKMLHIRASVLWGRLYSCLVFWKPSSVIELLFDTNARHAVIILGILIACSFQQIRVSLILNRIIVGPNWFWLDWDWFIWIDVRKTHF